LRRNIEVTNRQVNHIGKVVQTAISGGSVFDDFDDPVKALPDGVGQIPVDIGENILEVVSQGSDKLTQRGNAASQGSGRPSFEELLRRAAVAVIPEVLELILEHPSAMDATIGITQIVEKAGMPLGAISGVHGKQPAHPLDRLASLGVEVAPLFLSYLVERFVQGLHDVEAVDDERGIGAVMLDGLGIGRTHVATGPLDPFLLPLAQALVEESVNRLAALTPAYPQDTSTVQIIDDGGVFTALAEGDLINTESLHAPDLMAISHAVDNPVQEVGERRGSHLQDLGGGLLGHDLAQGTDPPLQAVGDARQGRRPGDLLLDPPVGWAKDRLWGVPENNLHAHECEVLPPTKLGSLVHDPATPPARRAAATVFVRFDGQVKFFATVFEPEHADFHALQA